MTEIVKLKGSPIQRRQARMRAFKAFVASNRKSKSIKELISLFNLEFGIRRKVAEEYLQLLLDSGIYKKYHVGHSRFVLLTPSE